MVERETLAQIILNFQDRSLPHLVKRELEVDLEVPLRRASVILGPRRSGKTYYLYFLIKRLLEGGIKKERILYVDFEDPKLFGATLEDLISLVEVFYEIYPRNKSQKVWFFFDEIQNDNLLVITFDFESEENIKGKKIKFVPLWKWLLT